MNMSKNNKSREDIILYTPSEVMLGVMNIHWGSLPSARSLWNMDASLLIIEMFF